MPIIQPGSVINRYLQSLTNLGKRPIATGVYFGQLQITNSDNSFVYLLSGSKTLSNITITLPEVSGDDTLVMKNSAQVLFNKDLSDPSNIILVNATDDTLTDTNTRPGDVLVSNGRKFSSMSIGSANQIFAINPAANGVVWSDPSALPDLIVSPIVKRQGRMIPSGNAQVLDGLLSAHTTVGTVSTIFDTTEGVCVQYVSAASSNVNAGLISATSGVGIGRTLFAARMVIRAKIDSTTSARFYVGITSATALPISDTPLASTDSGVVVGFRSTDTNFSVISNNGGGQAATATSIGIAKDAAYHTIEINWPTGGASAKVIFDGTIISLNVAASLPATTANLFFNAVGQTTTTTARTFTIHGIYVRADK